jgi:oligoribonuclease
MDAWNKGTHGRSGLIDKVKASTVTEAEAEQQIIDFLSQYVPKGTAPM